MAWQCWCQLASTAVPQSFVTFELTMEEFIQSIQPYSFEPVYTDGEHSSDSEDSDLEPVIGSLCIPEDIIPSFLLPVPIMN